MTTITERVAVGAAWLDENKPGWDAQVDLGRLEMTDECLCVLGQVYAIAAEESEADNGYDYAAVEMAAPVHQGGFWLAFGEAAQYADLGTEWKRLIAERRSQS